MRRCGWAFIQQGVGGAPIASVSGVLTGPVQTVARAELMAFVEALRSTACNVTVFSDAAYVVNEFGKLQRGVFPSKHRDLGPLSGGVCTPDLTVGFDALS